MKRLFDMVLAGCAIIFLFPVMVTVALLVRANDGGPALFRQTRIGLRGRPFGLLKFRSMVVDAELRGGFATLNGDQRVTPIGRFLRRTSIDELPQLLNIIRGDMSIVGPRPDVPAQQSLYSPADWHLRHSVRPGLTGLAQADLRSAATMEERTNSDLTYVRSRSMWLDIQIILRTARQLLTKATN